MNNKSPWNVSKEDRDARQKANQCEQCGKDMGYEYLLGPVCGKCCRVNHAHLAGRGK